eukprot:TRINITY_DN2892_c0_g1_i3.p1 TRINITY_DN2892_c0_g1~~TRINITY_DN2892_c0_g1_i3.p1  ORF type:complete len:181 (-),score=40.13 TRINITY_DN2892_c0_g1_i3:80-622(-)
MVRDSGLSDICEEQENKFEIIMKSTKDFNQVLVEFKQQETGVGTVLLKQVAAEISLHLNKDLVDSVIGIIKNLDPELMELPPFFMLSYFKNLQFDLQFDSPTKLPQEFQKYFMTSAKKYYDKDSDKSPEMLEEEIFKLMELMDGEFQVYATIQDIAAIQIEAKGHHLTKLLQQFGGILKL